MIFNVIGHINMIRNGLFYDLASKPEFSKYIKGVYPPRHRSGAYPLIIKTQTRRLNRGIYQVGRNYAVQPKRGVRAEPGIRIVMDRIWEEQIIPPYNIRMMSHPYAILSEGDAWAEGGYTPEEFEKLFRELNPNWNGIIRYGFEFHVIEVQT